MSYNRVIGKNNKLPWYFPEDLRFFKKTTIGRKIVMGRKTFDSIGILPKRETYVVSANPNKELKILSENKQIKIIKDLRRIPKDAMICGGANLYSQMLEMCFNLFLTVINKEYIGDTFFPYFEDTFKLIDKTIITTKDNVNLEFRHYINTIVNDYR